MAGVRGGVIQLAAWCALGALALWAVGRLWPVLWPLLWPFAFGGTGALIMEPAVRWWTLRGMRRGLAAALCLGGAVLAGVMLSTWAAVAIWHELWALRDRLPALYTAARATVADLGQRAGTASAGLPPGMRRYLEDELARGYASGVPLVQRLAAGLQHGVAVLPDTFFALLVAFAAAFFVSRDRSGLRAWAVRWLPSDMVVVLIRGARAVEGAVWAIARAQLLLAAVTFLVSVVGLWVIGAPYVVLAALLAAIFDVLPIVGPTALYLPWIVGCALFGLGGAALALTAVLLGVLMARWLLTPLLVGAQAGLHPFAAVAAMYVGAHLAGLVGLLLGPLMAAALRGLLAPAEGRVGS